MSSLAPRTLGMLDRARSYLKRLRIAPVHTEAHLAGWTIRSGVSGPRECILSLPRQSRACDRDDSTCKRRMEGAKLCNRLITSKTSLKVITVTDIGPSNDVISCSEKKGGKHGKASGCICRMLWSGDCLVSPHWGGCRSGDLLGQVFAANDWRLASGRA